VVHDEEMSHRRAGVAAFDFLRPWWVQGKLQDTGTLWCDHVLGPSARTSLSGHRQDISGHGTLLSISQLNIGRSSCSLLAARSVAWVDADDEKNKHPQLFDKFELNQHTLLHYTDMTDTQKKK